MFLNDLREQGLTVDEQRVAVLLCAGWTRVEIGRYLDLTPREIKGIQERLKEIEWTT